MDANCLVSQVIRQFAHEFVVLGVEIDPNSRVKSSSTENWDTAGSENNRESGNCILCLQALLQTVEACHSSVEQWVARSV